MKIEGIRLIESILTQLSFTSYIYKPTGTKLAAVTITTFLEDEVLAVLVKEVKMRKDSLEEFVKADRKDLIDLTQQELDIFVQDLRKLL